MNAGRSLLWVLVAAGFLAGCDCCKAPNSLASTKSQGTFVPDGSGIPLERAVTGKAVFVGVASPPKLINMAAIPACAALHPNGVFEESVVVGAKHELKNVVVYVKDGAKLGAPIPTAPATLDIVGCMYSPHVLVVTVGQEIMLKNTDGILHNVHALTRLQPEFSAPMERREKIEAALTPETFPIKCDVHPWMKAWAVVLDHPFATVTGDDGVFAIKGLKDGKYTLVAWHEKLGMREAEVEVKDGRGAVEFRFEPRK
jgi:plastocyanin